jgi:hypothetical protein
MVDSLRFWSVVILITGGIVVVGWKEPLRYRFMSRQEIDAELHPKIATPVPATPKPNWMWDPSRKTKLDETSYNRAQPTLSSPNRGTQLYTPAPR